MVPFQEDYSGDPTYHGQVDPITADKRGRVIPRSNLRRMVVPLDVAGNEQQFRVRGDFIQADSNSTGVALIKLNNTSEDPWPLTALAGMEGMPIEDIFLTWAAQPGKVLNIWYGYQARLINPNNAIASIGSITNPVGVQGPRGMFGTQLGADQPVIVDAAGYNYGASFASTTVFAANTPVNIIAAASNLAGYILLDCQAFGVAAGAPNFSFLAKATAPATVLDGDVLAIASFTGAGPLVPVNGLGNPRRVASGKRLDAILAVVSTSNFYFANYMILG